MRPAVPLANIGPQAQVSQKHKNYRKGGKPMLVRTIRKPGDPGTRKLVQKYGNLLVCIRYRYDPAKCKRYKTVELIVAEESWLPPPEPHPEETSVLEPRQYTPLVPVRIRFHEKELQRQIKAIGGTWEPVKKLWYAPEEYVQRIGLHGRIVR